MARHLAAVASDRTAMRCTCGGALAVVGTGAFQARLRQCRECLAQTAATQDAKEAQAARQARHRQARLDAPRRRGWSFASYPDDRDGRRAVAAARSWVAAYSAAVTAGDERERGRNLLIVGPVGAGKTGLAWSALTVLVDGGRSGLFVNARDLLAELRDAYRDGATPTTYDRACAVAVLVLDDLGAERPTAWGVEQIARLVDHRYAALLPTIVSSNHTPDRLIRHLAADDAVASGQRVVSRLCEDAVQIQLSTADRRRPHQPTSPGGSR